jgi:HEPN domain-containing protein
MNISDKSRIDKITTKDILNEALPQIDAVLASRNDKLSLRPVKAAVIFVEHYIAKIENENKDDLFDKPWFVAFLNYIDDWYRERYRDSYDSSSTNFKGLVFLHSYPFLLDFPISKYVDEGDKDTCSLYFLSDYCEHDDWKSYVQQAPNLNTLSEHEHEKLKSDVVLEIGMHRNAFHNYAMMDDQNLADKSSYEYVRKHLENAILNICSSVGGSFNIAIWDLHLALEKLLKLIIEQEKGDYPKHHNLNKLLTYSTIKNNEKIECLLSQFPNHKEVIDMRYGKPEVTDIEQVRAYYTTTVQLILELSKYVKTKLSVHNAVFYLKRGKYAGTTLAD